MYYKDQLALNGQINNIGEFIKENVGKSYRLGLEVGVLARLSEKLQLSANATLSNNKIMKYTVDVKEQDPFNPGNQITVRRTLGGETISFSPNLIANGNVAYSPFKNFNFGVTAQYVGKQFLDNSGDRVNQLEDYVVPDFNMSYRLPFKKNEVILRFLLNNFTNTKYVNNGYISGEPFYFSQAGINIMFGVSLKFH